MFKSRFNSLIIKKEIDEYNSSLYLDITLKTPLKVEEVLKTARMMDFHFQEFHCMSQVCEIVTYFNIENTSKEEIKQYLKQLKIFSNKLDKKITNTILL